MKIVSFGEILWDHIGDGWYIGGAPFNLAAHCSRMGVSATLVSSVGEDKLGRKAISVARECGIETDFIRVNRQFPTGTVEISLHEDGSHDFTIHDNVAWDDIAVSAEDARTFGAGGVDAVCFGTLAQRSAVNRSGLKSLLDIAAPRAVFYDVNLRQHYYETEWIEWSLRTCTILKCNAEEAAFLARYLFGRDMEEEEFARSAARHYNIITICITRGVRGAAVLHDGVFIEVPGVAVETADTVGAGDAFSAAFLRSFLAGHDVGTAARFAVRIGAFVASRRGAVPEYSGEIAAIVESMAG